MMRLALFVRALIVLASAAAVVACSSTPARPLAQQYEFAAAARLAALPFSSVDVSASAWLGGSGMQYRFRSSGLRAQFTQSRWNAPLADQLQTRLGHALASAPAAKACHLQLELNDVVQIFAAPNNTAQSVLHLDARASLGPERKAAPLTIELDVPAGADAASAVGASNALLEQLGQQLATWGKQHCQ